MPFNSPSQLVEEIPIAININGISFSVMLASPHDIEDFVVGYLFSESVINQNVDIHDIDIQSIDDALQVEVTIANRCLEKLNSQKRELKGISGCGLCGTKALALAFPPLTALVTQPPINLSLVQQLKGKLRDWQILGQQSGALHAAFWLDQDLQIQFCREDIGRHNALDKTLGHLLRKNIDTTSGSLLVTSRCSVELVQKAIRAKVGHLISLASPSTLAVRMASSYNLQLVHIPKSDAPYYLAGEQHAS